MFNNRFNSTKKDPLVEAVQTAMQDGEIRRQAEAFVNEEFGVFNRNAVVREQLAAYDARLEEAYKCMKEGEKKDEPKLDMKKREQAKKDYSKMRERMVGKGKDLETTRKIVGEAKKLADKDYDKDGKVESPKDEVWGSRFRAAKMAGKMEEEQIDEISKDLATRYFKKATKDARYAPQDKAVKRFAGAELAFKKKWGGAKVAATEETQIDEIKVSTAYSYSGKKMEKERKGLLPGDRNPTSKTELKNMKNAAERTDKDYYKKRGFKKVDEESMDEAAYSAKAARAGKDIGKPGKEFKKIAAKAGKKYGSEERGKKVAGAILARIRAKHMKEENLEELSAFGRAFQQAGGKQFSFGGKTYSGARADGKSSTASSSGPQSNAGLRGATGFPSRNITPSKAEQNPRMGSTSSSGPQDNPGLRGSSMPQTPKAPTAADRWNASKSSAPTSAPAPTGGPARDVGMTGKAGGEKGVTSGSTVSLDRPGNVGASTPSSPPEQSRAAPGTFAARSAAGEMKADAASAGVKKLMSMNESVQIGANRYRIV